MVGSCPRIRRVIFPTALDITQSSWFSVYLKMESTRTKRHLDIYCIYIMTYGEKNWNSIDIFVSHLHLTSPRNISMDPQRRGASQHPDVAVPRCSSQKPGKKTSRAMASSARGTPQGFSTCHGRNIEGCVYIDIRSYIHIIYIYTIHTYIYN